jgi:hypothetical protein
MLNNLSIPVILSVIILLCMSYLSAFLLGKPFIIVLIACYLLLSFFIIIRIRMDSTHEYTKYNAYKNSDIPNIIYTYWHSTTLPPFIEKCISSWKKHLPGYTIHVIHDKNISDFIDRSITDTWKKSLTHQQRADLIRLELLYNTGGIWLDASIILSDSLDWVHSYQRHEQSEFVGFKIDYFQTNSTPVVENWFMASIPHSKFIKDWRAEFNVIKYKDVKSFVNGLKHKKVDFQDIYDPYYLTMHISCLSILKHKTYALSLLTAEKGPLKYLSLSFMSPLFFPIICISNGFNSPIVKIRGGERTLLEWFKLNVFI